MYMKFCNTKKKNQSTRGMIKYIYSTTCITKLVSYSFVLVIQYLLSSEYTKCFSVYHYLVPLWRFVKRFNTIPVNHFTDITKDEVR